MVRAGSPCQAEAFSSRAEQGCPLAAQILISERGLGHPAVCGIFLDQGWKRSPLRLQADS